MAAATGIDIFDNDPALAAASDRMSVTEQAVKSYVDAAIAGKQGISAVLAALSAVMSATATAPAQRAAIGANIADVTFFFAGAPSASQVIYLKKFARATVFPINLTGSQGEANTAATASTVLTINKNGTPIGTITFAIAGVVPTFAFAAAVTFTAGDILTVTAPGSPDATLADIGVTLVATY